MQLRNFKAITFSETFKSEIRLREFSQIYYKIYNPIMTFHTKKFPKNK